MLMLLPVAYLLLVEGVTNKHSTVLRRVYCDMILFIYMSCKTELCILAERN